MWCWAPVVWFSKVDFFFNYIFFIDAAYQMNKYCLVLEYAENETLNILNR
jgi:hypothetical protein